MKYRVNWIMTGTSEIEADDPTQIEDMLNDDNKLTTEGLIHEVRVGDIIPFGPAKDQP
jgi:hypothetical protein